jgi:hypothetical protein
MAVVAGSLRVVSVWVQHPSKSLVNGGAIMYHKGGEIKAAMAV